MKIDFVHFCWQLYAAMDYDIIQRKCEMEEGDDADFNGLRYEQFCTWQNELDAALTELEIVFEARDVREFTFAEQRIQREDLEPPSNDCDCGVCWAYEPEQEY